MKSLFGILLVISLVLIVFVGNSNVEAISSPCSYCKYCTFCSECSKCPCDSTKNKNCDACKYCTYCKACSACDTICSAGGIADKISNMFYTVREKLGFGVENVSDDEISKDLNNYKIPADKLANNKYAKSEL